mmetsp:Transcript_24669/g.68637  ORF Transcript_24669/g.68637 Transcript_24669/m.68637 type:complete len:257 (+) Transcript_24669:835-1605(+)
MLWLARDQRHQCVQGSLAEGTVGLAEEACEFRHDGDQDVAEVEVGGGAGHSGEGLDSSQPGDLVAQALQEYLQHLVHLSGEVVAEQGNGGGHAADGVLFDLLVLVLGSQPHHHRFVQRDNRSLKLLWDGGFPGPHHVHHLLADLQRRRGDLVVPLPDRRKHGLGEQGDVRLERLPLGLRHGKVEELQRLNLETGVGSLVLEGVQEARHESLHMLLHTVLKDCEELLQDNKHADLCLDTLLLQLAGGGPHDCRDVGA